MYNLKRRNDYMRNFKKVIINERGEERVRNMHPWVFEGNIDRTDEDIIDGEIVDVLNKKEKYLGSGFYNSNSKIRVRIISRNTNDKFRNDYSKLFRVLLFSKTS